MKWVKKIINYPCRDTEEDRFPGKDVGVAILDTGEWVIIMLS